MSIKEKTGAFVLQKAMSGNPEENLPKLLNWADGFDRAGNWEE